MKIYLVRHSMTAGNMRKCYIGRKSDESLCDEGIRLAVSKISFFSSINIDCIFSSPMKRCIETADILFPQREIIIYENFAECDFGKFESKNYEELSGDADYQKWIDSGGTMPFPEGESPQNFRKRCCLEFEKMIRENSFETAVIIAHGGTFMSVLSEYEIHKKGYFEWNIKHCEPLECDIVCDSPPQLYISL